MTRKAFLAALALACACIALIVTALPPAPQIASAAGYCLVIGGALFLIAVAPRRPLPTALALFVGSLWTGSAVAAEVVTAPAATAVVLPWGDWIVAIGQAVTAVLLPVLVGLISRAVYQVAPWAMLFLTQKRIEQMAEAVTDYALNAVGGVAKGQQLTIPVGSAVIAKAVQRAVDVVPAKVIAAAGGPQGIAEIVFRRLTLVPEANAANTLAPAQAAIVAK